MQQVPAKCIKIPMISEKCDKKHQRIAVFTTQNSSNKLLRSSLLVHNCIFGMIAITFYQKRFANKGTELKRITDKQIHFEKCWCLN